MLCLAAASEHDFQQMLFRLRFKPSEVTRVYTPYELRRHINSPVMISPAVANGAMMDEWERAADDMNVFLMEYEY